MSKKEKTLKRVKTPSRRKFFKAAAALKNLRLEGVLIPFNVFFFFDMSLSPIVVYVFIKTKYI